MLVVQPVWAAQRELPLPPSLPTSVFGGAPAANLPHLPEISLGVSPIQLDGPAAPVPNDSNPNDANKPQTPSSDPSGPSSAPKSRPVDPPFYGRQKLPSEKPRARKYVPTAQDSELARAEFLRIAAVGQEIFNAPTWFEKQHHSSLKKAIFAIAFLDEALTDFANGQEADVPADLADSDVAAQVIRRRTEAYEAYAAARREILAQDAQRAMKRARIKIERWHRDGLASAAVDATSEHAEILAVAESYRRMQDIAEGKADGVDAVEVERIDKTYLKAVGSLLNLRRAKALDARLAAARPQAIDPKLAKAIYDRSVRDARDNKAVDNILHVAARAAAVKAGTVLPAPMLGKQIRPTCTMHMLQSLLAAMGIRRSLPGLVAEARAILNDPFVGMTTAFKLAQQIKLFEHYGKVALFKDRLLETLIAYGRNLKIGIEIGDPIYKHSLLLEGFYELDGQDYVALRDSTSYFPTRMTLEDFAKVLTSDDAILFLEARGKPSAP